MRTRTSPVVLGFIWGMFSMLLSFAVISVFASLKLDLMGFPLFAYNAQTQYIIIGAVFLLSVLGAVGAGIVHRLSKLGGAFMLFSCTGVALFLFVPVLTQSFSFAPLERFGIAIGPLALLITNFVIIVMTMVGLAGGILAFIPKIDRMTRPQKKLPKKQPAFVESGPIPAAQTLVNVQPDITVGLPPHPDVKTLET
jgi:hypothetical protein